MSTFRRKTAHAQVVTSCRHRGAYEGEQIESMHNAKGRDECGRCFIGRPPRKRCAKFVRTEYSATEILGPIAAVVAEISTMRGGRCDTRDIADI